LDLIQRSSKSCTRATRCRAAAGSDRSTHLLFWIHSGERSIARGYRGYDAPAPGVCANPCR